MVYVRTIIAIVSLSMLGEAVFAQSLPTPAQEQRITYEAQHARELEAAKHFLAQVPRERSVLQGPEIKSGTVAHAPQSSHEVGRVLIIKPDGSTVPWTAEEAAKIPPCGPNTPPHTTCKPQDDKSVLVPVPAPAANSGQVAPPANSAELAHDSAFALAMQFRAACKDLRMIPFCEKAYDWTIDDVIAEVVDRPFDQPDSFNRFFDERILQSVDDKQCEQWLKLRDLSKSLGASVVRIQGRPTAAVILRDGYFVGFAEGANYVFAPYRAKPQSQPQPSYCPPSFGGYRSSGYK